MKRKKIVGLSMMLATAVVSAAFGGALLGENAAVADEAKTYALSDIFSVTDATVGAETLAEKNTTAFTLSNNGSVTLKRSLALKWYAAKNQASYFTMKFAFKTLDFTSVTFEMDTASAWATKDEKATNKITFTNESGVIYVAINGGAKQAVTVAAGQVLTLALNQSTNVDGEFGVTLDGTGIGKFENIGANYAEYSYNEKEPLTITAETANADAKAVVYLTEINGQSFDNIAQDKVTDTVAPVLVVNEEVNGFLLGTAFSLDYVVVDVLKSKVSSPTFEYYQYNPTVTAGSEEYKTLTTSTYFMDTVYEKDGKNTTVYKENGNKEFISVRVKASDDTFTDTSYDLSWYASTVQTLGEKDYIILDRNTDGPTYNYITTAGTDNVVDTAAYEAAATSFKTALGAAASEVYAGSNSYIYFPSLQWLFKDNNGYRNLKFTISYKTPSSTSASTSSSLSYNALKLAVSDEGAYEFKVFANDKAGNTMKYYLDGELVDVTTSNVWDIEEIPSFSFEIENKGLKVEDPTKATDRKDTEVIDKTYTLEDIKVVGASSLKEEYKLYKVDISAYNALETVTHKVSNSSLSTVTYAKLFEKVSGKTNTVTDGNYFEFYMNAYVDLLAEQIGATDAEKTELKKCFTEIKEYDSRITEENAPTEWEAYNKYSWLPNSQSFKTVEKGSYLILADYWEEELPAQRATAYKLITVESETDKIEGASDWLKNNVVSVVLFSIAGVMLILIIVLLLIKPSDETLEDVDAKAEKTKKKKK